MDVFFADDSAQSKPTRPGVGPLLAAGGLHVPGEEVGPLERELAQTCYEAGFPGKEEFKWSPGRELWMYSNLVGDARRDFFLKVLRAASRHEATACVVMVDTSHAPATGAKTPELDVLTLLVERVHGLLVSARQDGHLLVDRPGGDRQNETRFLSDAISTIVEGTEFVIPERIALVTTGPSQLVRCLQLADLITSCTTQYVAGETTYAPPVFEGISRLLRRDLGRVGGYGLKIHPDFKYANLYHWLGNDTHFWRANMGIPMPLAFRPYATDALTP